MEDENALMFNPETKEADYAIIDNARTKLSKEDADKYKKFSLERGARRAALTKALTALNIEVNTPGVHIEALYEHRSNVSAKLMDVEEEDRRAWMYWEDDPQIQYADARIAAMWTELAMKRLKEARIKIHEIENSTSTMSIGPASDPPAAAAAATLTAHTAPTAPTAPTGVKLPKVELPTFKGESPAEYQSFKNQFDSLVHNSTNLDDVQKFLYLTSCCEGEAKKIAEGFKCTGANYKELYDSFKSSFGKPRLVIQSHINRILELESFKSHNLKSFLNTLESSLRSLGEYKIDPENLSPVIVPLVETKMPRDVLTKWRKLISNQDDFSTAILISFLHERVECLPAHTSSTPHRDDKSHTSQTKEVKPKTTSLLTTTAKSKSELSCKFCNKKGHIIDECRSFLPKSREEKVEFIKVRKICFRCLEDGHWSKFCPKPKECEKCHKRHPTNLHFDQPQPQPQKAKQEWSQPIKSEKPNDDKQEKQENVSKTTISTVSSSQQTLLKTCEIMAVGKGKSSFIRALLDDGSQNTWISQQTVDELNLPIKGYGTFQVSVAFKQGYDPPQKFPIVEVDLTTSTGELFTVEALVRSEPLCADVQSVDFVPQERFKHLKNLVIADAYPRGEEAVDLVIGGDYSETIRTGNRKKAGPHQPIAVETLFGWILGGPCIMTATNTTRCYKVASTPFAGIEMQIKKFYEAETLPQEKQEAKSFREQVRSNMTYDPLEQRYTVSIPYTERVKELQSNKELAYAMSKKQEKKLTANPKVESMSKDYFNVQLENGMIEEVLQDDPCSQKHYLPWHPVVREDHPTTPCRNVMNASQKDSAGLSLNQCQSAGPNLLPDVCGLALNFRNSPIGTIMDISKMFLNIRISEDQKDLHRFFAYGKTLRQAMLLFGEASSPYLALETVLYHADYMEMANRFKLAAETVRKFLYMDDAITGSNSVAEGVQLIEEMIAFFESMHLKVHKINSSSKEVLKAFDPELLENTTQTSVLGIEWDTENDTLALKPLDVKNDCDTKRKFLATLASIYDPLGFHAPLTCWGKMIMQNLWALLSEWDKKIPDDIQKEIAEWTKATNQIPKVPRHWGTIDEVHIFCDASEKALAAVAYGASNKGMGPAHLMLAKTRVKPLKAMTIPRMELQGAVLAANMAEFIKKQLGIQKFYFWTDSAVALGWIRSESSKYKVFVGNRTKLIQEKTNKEDWRWVPGIENPADIPSRGTWPLNKEQMKLWLNGPEFINNGCYPEQPQTKAPTEECKKTTVQAVTVEKPKPIIDMNRFSSINRLLNTTAYVFRFGKRNTGARKGPPTASEREVALQKLILQDQKFHFSEDINDLKEGQLKRSSKIRALNPYLNDQGILMMRGRVTTEPELVILHHKSRLTELLIQEAHKSNLHSGISHTLNELRAKYWILKGFATVKASLKACVVCKKVNSRLAEQQMADLPEWRTTPSPPFSHTGLDYAGPLFITKKGTQKRYILLFTCGVTRAVHLELTQTLDQQDFLLAFDRFTARRGVPSNMYSDNGTTFVAAAKMLPNITWQFNPPYAPWRGGFWERIVRSIKTPLRKIAGGARLKETELITLLTKIEAVINSRPLTTIHGMDSHRVITPAELLCGRQLQQLKTNEVDLVPAKRMKFLEELHKQFWNQWKNCYLPTLQSRPKWTKVDPNIKEGDIVLLLKENKKQHEWPMARVIESIKGRDGLVRTVKLLCDQKEVTRPIQLIVPLEVQNDDHKNTDNPKE